MRIRWNTNVNAPCCPGEIVADDGQTVLIQTDWDYPSVASAFGWDIKSVQHEGYEAPWLCAHQHTDGTVNCHDCGFKAGDFINAAGAWLNDNDGATVDDPGYFGGA